MNVSNKGRGEKPWYKSGAIKGAILVGVSAVLSPDVLNVLPPKYAAIGKAIGFVWSAIGLRRAM